MLKTIEEDDKVYAKDNDGKVIDTGTVHCEIGENLYLELKDRGLGYVTIHNGDDDFGWDKDGWYFFMSDFTKEVS